MTACVTFLSDFGLTDSYVAEVRAVFLRECPQVQWVEITQGVPCHDIRSGAFQLLRAYRHFPRGSYHFAVVDPGVGSDRKCVWVDAGSYHFVGPDNGLLKWAVEDCAAKTGKAPTFWEIPQKDFSEETFQARDVMAPFLTQVILGRVGELKLFTQLTGISFPHAKRVDGKWVAEAISVDHFGNVVTSLRVEQAEVKCAKLKGLVQGISRVKSYSEISPGALGVLKGSHGFYEIAGCQIAASDLLKGGVGLSLEFEVIE